MLTSKYREMEFLTFNDGGMVTTAQEMSPTFIMKAVIVFFLEKDLV